MPSFAPLSSGRAVSGRTLAVALLFFHLAFTGNAVALPRLDVPYVPTPPDVVDRMLEMAEVQPDDRLIDLGSGDGRIVIAAVRDWGVSDALGIDLDAERVAEAEENARQAGVEDRAIFEQGDLFEKNFSDATVLTMYLLSSVNYRLKPVILDTMAPGTRIVSHAFDMEDWEPDQFDIVGGSSVYLWIVPAKVAGNWQLTAADGSELTLVLEQINQRIEGTVIDGERNVPLGEASLRGDEIRFSVGPEHYVGKVDGDSIVPQEDSASQDWHARRI